MKVRRRKRLLYLGQGLLEILVRSSEVLKTLVGDAPDSRCRFFEQIVIVLFRPFDKPERAERIVFYAVK